MPASSGQGEELAIVCSSNPDRRRRQTPVGTWLGVLRAKHLRPEGNAAIVPPPPSLPPPFLTYDAASAPSSIVRSCALGLDDLDTPVRVVRVRVRVFYD
mmetsp:Transcript_50665/g.152611  ORF Transcript_50665/g.152611 Transcript_50665/m.152611 type:complete len:99 (+) Transcript_50665:1-297(+)